MTAHKILATAIVVVLVSFGEAKIPSLDTEVCTASSHVQDSLFSLDFKKVDGGVYLLLNIKNPEGLRERIGESCWNGNSTIAWHIHDKADFAGDYAIGDEACGAPYTGGHWDPTLACSPSSGNEICKLLSVPPSSALPKELQTGDYQCTPELYNKDHLYGCELGDLAGKYGKLKIPELHGDADTTFIYVDDSADEANTCELRGKSLALHCEGSTKRALCVRLNLEDRSIESFFKNVNKIKAGFEDRFEEPHHKYQPSKETDEDKIKPASKSINKVLPGYHKYIEGEVLQDVKHDDYDEIERQKPIEPQYKEGDIEYNI